MNVVTAIALGLLAVAAAICFARAIRPGTIVDRAFYDEVVALAKKYRFFVISDFAYGDIVFDGADVPSFLSAKGASDPRLGLGFDLNKG